MENIQCVLLDIEGTICPISFVKDTLFPYALKALPDVLASHWDDEDFRPYRDDFPESASSSREALQAHVEDLTKKDVKVAYLKNLQGYLWENGYKTGAYSTPLFSDVAPQLKRWKEYGVILAIYSSGSVFAQKLLFGHVQTTKPITGQKRGLPTSHEDSNDGDVEGRPSKKRAADVKAGSSGEVEREVDSASTGLHDGFPADENAEKGGIRTQDAESASDLAKNTEDLQYLIADWFDTTNAGPKTEASSYEKIAHSLKVSPTHVLFLTDNVLEVRAAQKAGMLSHAVVRPGNAPLSEEDKDRLTVVSSFNDINMPKRQPHEETLLRAKSEQKSDNS